MRKYLALLLAAALALTLAACGAAQPSGAPADGGESAEPEAAETAEPDNAETAGPEADALTRQTQYGPVQGVASDGAEIWYAIPYGAAPVGELRWTPPQDPGTWSDTLDCTSPGEMAYQMASGEASGTEDCLNLDVYAPEGAENLPVLVFLHGGNNQTGNTQELIGSELVTNDECVFVTLNYRLGIFGFNCLPALQTEEGSTGNYAMLDVIKALDWVKANIAAFGGNPDNITISGFSAGGRDVMAMLVSPMFAGKFQKAIAFSGGMTIADVDESVSAIAAAVAPLAVEDAKADDEAAAKEWLMTDGADVKEWLYGVSSERLCALMGNAGIRMSVFPHLYNDGVMFPAEGFDTDAWNSVPVIMLTGSSEFSFFDYGDAFWGSEEAAALDETDLQAAKDFANTYGSDMYRIFNAQCSAEKMYDNYGANIYLCQVNYGGADSAYAITPYGAFHGIFVPMLSSVNNYSALYDFSEAGYQSMAAAFNAHLKSFLATGDPNAEGLAEWSAWTPENPVSMVLDAADGAGSGECRDVSTTYEDIMNRMDADESVSDEGKNLAIANVMNGRWFSAALDERYGNPSLWK